MTVCEIATHRIFVALLHSRHLRRHAALRQQWVEALDGLGGFVDLIPGRSPGAQHSGPGQWGRWLLAWLLVWLQGGMQWRTPLVVVSC
jgi:hypothetical protein